MSDAPVSFRRRNTKVRRPAQSRRAALRSVVGCGLDASVPERRVPGCYPLSVFVMVLPG